MALDFYTPLQRFESVLTADVIGLPVEYENAPQSPGLKTAKKEHKPWARVTMRQGDGVTASIGTNPRHRYTGLVFVGVFYPLGKGSKPLLNKCSEISTLIAQLSQSAGFEGLFVRTPYLSSVMQDGSDWFFANVRVPFQFDNLAS